MIHSTKELRRRDIAASDGGLGGVHDLLFDDLAWKLRYLVVDTGDWLSGRRVIISPKAIESLQNKDGNVALSLTKEDIWKGPGIETDAPVSRQNEIAFADHFQWPRYWEETPRGVAMAPVMPSLQPVPSHAHPHHRPVNDAIPHGDPNLRSVAEVTGYHVAARDGSIGHVDDFLIDDEDWILRYLVVDTRNWWPGRRVLVAAAWARGIDWAEQKLLVDSDRNTIKQAPEYKPGMVVGRDLERSIFEHYGRRLQES